MPGEMDNTLSKDDILDNLLSDDESKEELKDEVLPLETEEKEEEEQDEKEESIELNEEDENKEEEEEPTESDLELVVAPKKKDILEAYPDIFKKFPYLEKAMYREQQYTELIPSIEDAKQLVETANEYNRLSESVLSGSASGLLTSVKETDPEAFNKLVDNYLPDLKKVDSNAFNHVIGNTVKELVLAMDREATNVGQRDENTAKTLRTAALILHQFIFGNSQFVPPQAFSKPAEKNEEAEKLQSERKQFFQDRLNATTDELETRINNVLTSTINQNIDPKGVMSDYVKRNATKDALDKTKSLMSKDTRFRSVQDALWKKAFESNFSAESINRIRLNYLNQAKTVLKQVIDSTRREALSNTNRNVVTEQREKKGPLPTGRSTPTNSGQKAKEVPKNMKTLDFLMQD